MTHQEALKAADQLLDLCTPDKMPAWEALEFLRNVVDLLQSSCEDLEAALEEQQ